MASTSSLNMMSIITAIVVAIIPLIVISTSGPNPAYSVIIPLFAYLLTSGMSMVYQYSACNKVNVTSAFLTNLLVLGSTFTVSIALFLEQIPFLKGFYGSYPPRNPISGLPYSESSAEYIAGMINENHYKIQPFTSIVTAVIPVYFNENTKLGIVYFYWMFFLTLLPFYFTLTVQGLCN